MKCRIMWFVRLWRRWEICLVQRASKLRKYTLSMSSTLEYDSLIIEVLKQILFHSSSVSRVEFLEHQRHNSSFLHQLIIELIRVCFAANIKLKSSHRMTKIRKLRKVRDKRRSSFRNWSYLYSWLKKVFDSSRRHFSLASVSQTFV